MIDECKFIEKYGSNESRRGMAGILKLKRIVMLDQVTCSFLSMNERIIDDNF